MPKTSSREIRSTHRELLRAHSTIRKNAQKATAVAKRTHDSIKMAKRYIVHFRSKTILLNKDLQSLRSRLLAAQEVFKLQRDEITLEKSRNEKCRIAMAEGSAIIQPLNEAYRKVYLAFLEQRNVIRNQQTLLKEPMDVARTMVALSNEL